MKTCAKIFIIIGMISGCIAIFPIIVGALALNKIKQARSKDELVTMGIVTLLLCSTLGGVFMLLIKDEELNEVVVTDVPKEEKKTEQTNEKGGPS